VEFIQTNTNGIGNQRSKSLNLFDVKNDDMASYSGLKPRQPGHYHKQKQERRRLMKF